MSGRLREWPSSSTGWESDIGGSDRRLAKPTEGPGGRLAPRPHGLRMIAVSQAAPHLPHQAESWSKELYEMPRGAPVGVIAEVGSTPLSRTNTYSGSDWEQSGPLWFPDGVWGTENRLRPTVRRRRRAESLPGEATRREAAESAPVSRELRQSGRPGRTTYRGQPARHSSHR